jgi:hypothetical protein
MSIFNRVHLSHFVLATVLTATSHLFSAQTGTLENANYRVELLADKSIIVTQIATDVSAPFSGDFEVVYQASKPVYSVDSVTGALQGTSTSTNVSFAVPSWGGETDFAIAPGTRIALAASDASISDSVITWSFDAGSTFSFAATITLPDDGTEPKLSWTVTPSSTQYFTIGYLGAPASDISSVSELYTPGIWTGLRFPDKEYLVDESRCALPFAVNITGGVTSGLIVDPEIMTFRMPLTSNSRFGIGIRNADGLCQPIIYAPLYGTTASRLSLAYTFSMRLIVGTADCFSTFRDLAETLYGFSDYRTNLTGGSLNTALDNMQDFIMNSSGNNYSYWEENEKANDYVNDDPEYARFQSGAIPLSLAMIRDSSAIYDDRALPSIEYFASRKRNLFKIDGYDADYPMGGPMSGTYIGDWAALSALTSRRTVSFELLGRSALNSSIALEDKIDTSLDYSRNDSIDLAKKWLRNLISYYRLTGEEEYLNDAVFIADKYIYYCVDNPQTDFRDTLTSFWCEVAPNWDTLSELYEITGYERYRDAELKAMQQFVMRMNFCPKIPDGDTTIDGDAIPSWILSEIGLISEAAGTSNSHRGIFMSAYASAYLLRTAEYSEDPFYAYAAKASIIGRFLNYPGYTYKGSYSTLFTDPDYPLQNYATYSNTAHMNHPMPMAAMIVDYLVADAEYRSGGSIRFPGWQSDSGGYFHTRVYGREPGEFFGDSDVWLWMPKALLSFSGYGAEQVNYIAAHGNECLYISLSNQSSDDVTVTLQVNSEYAAWTPGAAVRIWIGGALASESASFGDGSITVTIPGDGLLSLAVDGVSPILDLQADYIDASQSRLTSSSYYNGTAPFGRNVGMIISLSEKKQSAYVYTDASPLILSSATLHYSINEGTEESVTKSTYPFEFTIPLPEDAATFKYWIEGSDDSQSDEVTLSLALTTPPDTPDEITATQLSQNSISLSWSAVDEASYYIIERSTKDARSFTTIATPTNGTLSYADSSLLSDTTYFYRICAVNSIGCSAWSATVSATTRTGITLWRYTTFGSDEDEGIAANSADPDGDGMSNLLEYAFGTSPVIAETSVFEMSISGLEFRFGARTDVGLQIMTSSDLENWNVAVESDNSGELAVFMTGFSIETLSSDPLILLLSYPNDGLAHFFKPNPIFL